jgi:hypothetical protein
VLDEQGGPFPRARLAVYRMDGGRATRLEVGTMARNDGRFERLPVPVGRFAVVASAPDHGPAWRILDDSESGEPVLLRCAPAVSITLTAPTASGGSPGPVRWLAWSADGVPAFDERLPWTSPASPTSPDALDRRLVHLPAGEWTFEAMAADGARAEQRVQVRDAVEVAVPLPARRD